MKRWGLVLILVSLLLPVATFAADKTEQTTTKAATVDHPLAGKKPFGLGVILGEPTGISGKYWLDGNNAIDFAAAWSFANDNDFHLHADYLVHVNNAFHAGEAPIHFYYGIGARFKNEKDSRLGIRIPVGLELIPSDAPIDLFVELAPILDLIPSTTFRINAAVGIRYFF